jgi:Zn ribbon nucleic-acid-binding protein
VGLDIRPTFIRIRLIVCFFMPGCEHKRTEFLMRRDGVDYMRCLDCDAVLESEDLEQLPIYDDEEEQPRRKHAS